jgi:hypothetical protein
MCAKHAILAVSPVHGSWNRIVHLVKPLVTLLHKDTWRMDIVGKIFALSRRLRRIMGQMTIFVVLATKLATIVVMLGQTIALLVKMIYLDSRDISMEQFAP